MSERGQKIFKFIVWLIIAILVVGQGFRLVDFITNPNSILNSKPISREEWVTMLGDGFGDESICESVSDGDEIITGKYAAITAMSALGEERLSYLSDKELNDDTKLELALEYGIVSKKKLNNKITIGEAEEILLSALNIYCNPEYYPEYFDVQTKVDVVDADRWNIIEYNVDTQTITANIADEAPEIGEIIMFTNEHGIAQARYVDQIFENGLGTYDVQVSPVENISDIFDSISFSGCSDFSYILSSERDIVNVETGIANNRFENPFITTVYAAEENPILFAGWEWFEDKTAFKKEEKMEDVKKCDIEFNVEILDSGESGGAGGITSYFTVKSDEKICKYKFTTDNSGKSHTTEIKNNEDTEKFQSSSKNTDSISQGIVANIKIENLGICSSGYWQWSDLDDTKNYVEVLVSADKVDISCSAKASCEKKVKIGTVEIPIAATYGVVSINLNLYLVISANGELSIWYEIDDPYVGLNVSMANGVKPLHGSSNKDMGVSAKVELSGGFIGEVAIIILDAVDLANPSVDVRLQASASTVDVKDKYKLKDEYLGKPCIELNVKAPVILLKASAGEDSVLNKILNILNVDATYDIKKEKSLTYHVEYEKDGSIKVIELDGGKKHDNVCKHIELKPVEVGTESIKQNIDDNTNEKVEEVEKTGNLMLEQAIEGELEKLLDENCGE